MCKIQYMCGLSFPMNVRDMVSFVNVAKSVRVQLRLLPPRNYIYSRHLFLFRKATCRSVSAQFSWHWQPTAKPPPTR